MRLGKHGFVQHLDEPHLGFRLRLSDWHRTSLVDFRLATSQLSLAFRRRTYRPLRPPLHGPETKWRLSSVADSRENGGRRREPGSRDVAGVSTGRDATERLTRPSPQRAALRLFEARVLRRGTERCWTRLITAGRPRILEPAGFIINPRPRCRPPPSAFPPSSVRLLPPLLFPTSESRQHEIPA